MKLTIRWVVVGLCSLAVCGLFLTSNITNAGSAAELKKKVLDLAALVKGGKEKAKDADKMAAAIAKKEGEVYYVMLLHKPSNKKGLGVGKGIVPDGIELKLRAMSRDLMSTQKLKNEAEALTNMAYNIKAINMIAHKLPPRQALKAKEWLKYCTETDKACGELVAAIKSGSTAEVKKAAASINTNCNNCHSKFR